MSNILDFSEVEIKQTTIITPGIHDVTIEKVEEGIMPFGEKIPCVTLYFKSTDGAILTESLSLAKTKGEQSKMTDFQKTIEKLAQIGSKTGNKVEEIREIKNITQLSAMIVGKPFRCKFIGSEYTGADGSIKVRTKLPLYRFTENINVSPTKLVFDKGDQFDYKPLPKLATEGTAAKSDDLPF